MGTYTTDTESLRQEAVWHQVPAERGSGAAGQPAEEGCEALGDGIGGLPVAARLRGGHRWEDIRHLGYRSLVAGGEEVAGDEGVAAIACRAPCT